SGGSQPNLVKASKSGTFLETGGENDEGSNVEMYKIIRELVEHGPVDYFRPTGAHNENPRLILDRLELFQILL
ncbi:unnamed protein product, partial [Nesidiocoris tenuis]